MEENMKLLKHSEAWNEIKSSTFFIARFGLINFFYLAASSLWLLFHYRNILAIFVMHSSC